MVAAGEVRPAPTELEATMLERTMELLAAAGYEHYEVSSYARPGFRCQHNLAYWSHQDYLGFGPSAHSFRLEHRWTRAHRWWNAADLDTYCARLAAGLSPTESEEQLESKELLEEQVLLGLRTGHLDLARLARDFGRDLEVTRHDTLRALSEADLTVIRDGILELTPRGFLLCDEVCLRLTK